MSSGGETVHASASHHRELRHHFESMAGQHEASAFGMWVFIAQEILFFGGMLTAYAIYRNLFYDAFAAAQSVSHVFRPRRAATTWTSSSAPSTRRC